MNYPAFPAQTLKRSSINGVVFHFQRCTVFVIGPRSNYNKCFRLLNADDAGLTDLFLCKSAKISSIRFIRVPT